MERIVGLALIFFLVWAWGNHTNTGKVVDINDLPKSTQEEIQEQGYIVFEKNSIRMIEDGTYQYKFRKYDPKYIESLPEYMYITSHSETPSSECFEFKGAKGNQYIFTYDYTTCHDYDTDFKLSAVIIVWDTKFMSVVTDHVDDYWVKFNEPYYKNVNIIVQLDSRLDHSIRYYNRQGDINSVIFYFYTEKNGEPLYLEVKIPKDELEKE